MGNDDDFEEEIDNRISELWHSYSTEGFPDRQSAYLAFLEPYLVQDNFHALLAFLRFSDDSISDFAKAEKILDRIDQKEKNVSQLVKLSICLEGHFYLVENSPVAAKLYKDTLLALSTEENGYIGEYLMALRHLQGKLGFSKDDEKFEYWIKNPVIRGELEATCTYIDYLLNNRRPVSMDLIEAIRAQLRDNPDIPEVHRLLKRVEKRRV